MTSRDEAPLDRPRLYVDFNERVDTNTYLLSREDTKVDSAGSAVVLRAGQRVHVYMPDGDANGAPVTLIATGIVEPNRETATWAARVRWCVRIDRRHE